MMAWISIGILVLIFLVALGLALAKAGDDPEWWD